MNRTTQTQQLLLVDLAVVVAGGLWVPWRLAVLLLLLFKGLLLANLLRDTATWLITRAHVGTAWAFAAVAGFLA